jgi:hypothetical protein
VRLPVYCDPTQPNHQHTVAVSGLPRLFPDATTSVTLISLLHSSSPLHVARHAHQFLWMDAAVQRFVLSKWRRNWGRGGGADPLNSTVQKGVSAPTVQLLFVSRRREVLPLHRLAQYSRVKLFLPQRVMNSRIDPFAGRTSRVPAPHTTHTCIKRATTGGGTSVRPFGGYWRGATLFIPIEKDMYVVRQHNIRPFRPDRRAPPRS